MSASSAVPVVADRPPVLPEPPGPRALGLAHLDDGALHAALTAARHAGDPLADRTIEAFRALPGGQGWRLLEDALTRGPAALDDPALPQALRELLASAAEAPPWLDLALVDAGVAAHWRMGIAAQTLALTYGSLAFGYQYGDLARPLAMTGRLERMAPRRVGETARWVLAAVAPGGMAPWAPGWASTIRVRLVHALVRDHLHRGGRWTDPEWGVPLSAAGLLATGIGGFLVVPYRAMRDLGLRATRADREARTALWRWISHVMGAPTALLPASWSEAERLVDVLEPLLGEPVEGSAELLDALTAHGTPSAQAAPGPAGWALQRLTTAIGQALTRRWMGAERARELGVGGAPLDRLVPLARPIARAHQTLLATGIVGAELRSAELQIAFLTRFLDRIGSPAATVSPAEATAR